MTGGGEGRREPGPSLVWTLHRTQPGAVTTAPADLGDLEALARLADAVLPGAVPGTAASAWRDAAAAGEPLTGSPREAVSGDHDWWWTAVLRLDEPQSLRLRSDGIATWSSVFLDGHEISSACSAFAAHEAVVEPATGAHVVSLVCRSLTGLQAPQRPRARWRSTLVPERTLRWHRTPLLGRIPWAGTAPVIGPWAGLRCEIVRAPDVRLRTVRTRVLPDGDGLVTVRVTAAAPTAVTLRCGRQRMRAHLEAGDGRLQLRIPEPARWWPATHGSPVLHELVLEADGQHEQSRRIGFRTVVAQRRDGGFRLIVNGRSVFARGAVWAPVDPLALGGDAAEIDRTVAALVASGANLLRVPGTDAYAGPALLEACDRRGAMLWQDTMLASYDPPEDPDWLATLGEEVALWARRLAEHPCLVVWSGGTENLQQAVLSGRGPQSWSSTALERTIPQALERAAPGLSYLAGSPSGGLPPTRIDTGVSHYFGVGAYRRPLSDARTAGVRFAAECLAFGCPPEEEAVLEAFGSAGADHDAVSRARWEDGAARDPGASWSFEQITRHYARQLHGAPPVRGIPRGGDDAQAPPETPEAGAWPSDRAQALALERETVQRIMTEVLAQWRRDDSTCDGAVVLASRDLAPGPGWGLLDWRGRPKAGLRGFAAACSPTAVTILDEGLDGLHAHVFHDRPEPLRGHLEIATTTAQGRPGPSARPRVELGGPGEAVIALEPELGGFLDLTGAWGFGPPVVDEVVVELVLDDGCATPAGAPQPLRARFHREGAPAAAVRAGASLEDGGR